MKLRFNVLREFR